LQNKEVELKLKKNGLMNRKLLRTGSNFNDSKRDAKNQLMDKEQLFKQ
jgi:hypothetical protein